MSEPKMLVDLGGLSGQVVIASEFPMIYRLTGCCKASVKGSSSGPFNVCRACYRVVSDEMGDAWMVDDVAGWDRLTGYVVESLVGIPFSPFSKDAAQEIAEGLTIAVRTKAESVVYV